MVFRFLLVTSLFLPLTIMAMEKPASLPSYAPFIRLSRDLQIEILSQIIESCKTGEEAIKALLVYMRGFYDPQPGRTQLYECQMATDRVIKALANRYSRGQNIYDTDEAVKVAKDPKDQAAQKDPVAQGEIVAKILDEEAMLQLKAGREENNVNNCGLWAMKLGTREAAAWFALLAPADRKKLLTHLSVGKVRDLTPQEIKLGIDGRVRTPKELKFLSKVGLDCRAKDNGLLAHNIRDLRVMQLLKEKGAELYGELLCDAAHAGADDVVKWLISNLGTAAVNTPRCGITPLMSAAMGGHDKAVQVLLSAGAEPNAKDKDSGCTAVIYAAMGNHLPTVKLLVEKGANPNPMFHTRPLLEQIIARSGVFSDPKVDFEPLIEYISQAEIARQEKQKL